MSLKTTIITTIMTQHVSISIPQHKDILLLSKVKENMHISLKPGKKNQMVLVPARTAFSSRTTLFLIFIDEIFSWFSICQITKSIHRHIRCANILVLNIYPPHTPPTQRQQRSLKVHCQQQIILFLKNRGFCWQIYLVVYYDVILHMEHLGNFSREGGACRSISASLFPIFASSYRTSNVFRMNLCMKLQI